jgi:excisionase family DNA binding protein
MDEAGKPNKAARRYLTEIAKRGGQAQKRKYGSKKLSEWGKKGGRPRKTTPLTAGLVLFSIPETAAMLSLSRRSIEKLVRAGKIRTERVGRKAMVSRSELERFAESPQYARAKVHGSAGVPAPRGASRHR